MAASCRGKPGLRHGAPIPPRAVLGGPRRRGGGPCWRRITVPERPPHSQKGPRPRPKPARPPRGGLCGAGTLAIIDCKECEIIDCKNARAVLGLGSDRKPIWRQRASHGSHENRTTDNLRGPLMLSRRTLIWVPPAAACDAAAGRGRVPRPARLPPTPKALVAMAKTGSTDNRRRPFDPAENPMNFPTTRSGGNLLPASWWFPTPAKRRPAGGRRGGEVGGPPRTDRPTNPSRSARASCSRAASRSLTAEDCAFSLQRVVQELNKTPGFHPDPVRPSPQITSSRMVARHQRIHAGDEGAGHSGNELRASIASLGPPSACRGREGDRAGQPGRQRSRQTPGSRTHSAGAGQLQVGGVGPPATTSSLQAKPPTPLAKPKIPRVVGPPRSAMSPPSSCCCKKGGRRHRPGSRASGPASRVVAGKAGLQHYGDCPAHLHVHRDEHGDGPELKEGAGRAPGRSRWRIDYEAIAKEHHSPALGWCGSRSFPKGNPPAAIAGHALQEGRGEGEKRSLAEAGYPQRPSSLTLDQLRGSRPYQEIAQGRCRRIWRRSASKVQLLAGEQKAGHQQEPAPRTTQLGPHPPWFPGLSPTPTLQCPWPSATTLTTATTPQAEERRLGAYHFFGQGG